jgi:prepilin-type N-terminal cleavage/methylation domain-containing protein
MKRALSTQTRGFTIIELLVASSVFSVILIICLTGVVKMGKIFYKGANTARTQEAARTVIDEISQSIQFNKGAVKLIVSTTNPGAIDEVKSGNICVGQYRYNFITNHQLVNDSPGPNQTINALRRDDQGEFCNPVTPSTPMTNPIELLGPGMRLSRFEVTPLDANPADAKIWKVDVWVTHGDEDLINRYKDGSSIWHSNCNSGAGSEYCAASELSTTVHRRL